jgi:hypothetical protein
MSKRQARTFGGVPVIVGKSEGRFCDRLRSRSGIAIVERRKIGGDDAPVRKTIGSISSSSLRRRLSRFSHATR